MNNSFKVVVDNTQEFKINSDDISKIDTLQTSSNSYHILKENKSFSGKGILLRLTIVLMKSLFLIAWTF